MPAIRDLAQHIAVYLRTLDDTHPDEYFMSARDFASWQLDKFMTWLEAHAAAQHGPSAPLTVIGRVTLPDGRRLRAVEQVHHHADDTQLTIERSPTTLTDLDTGEALPLAAQQETITVNGTPWALLDYVREHATWQSVTVFQDTNPVVPVSHALQIDPTTGEVTVTLQDGTMQRFLPPEEL